MIGWLLVLAGGITLIGASVWALCRAAAQADADAEEARQTDEYRSSHGRSFTVHRGDHVVECEWR